MKIGVFGRGKLGNAVTALASRESGLEVAWFIDLGESPSGRVDVALDASAAGAVRRASRMGRRDGDEPRHRRDRAGTARSSTPRGSGRPESASCPRPISPFQWPSCEESRPRAWAASRRSRPTAPSRSWSGTTRPRPTPPAAPRSSSPRPSSRAVPATPGGTRAGPRKGRSTSPASGRARRSATTRSGFETGADALVLSHEADSREIFAKGALVALRWIAGRKGLFTFDDLAEDIIDPCSAPEEETEMDIERLRGWASPWPRRSSRRRPGHASGRAPWTCRLPGPGVARHRGTPARGRLPRRARLHRRGRDGHRRASGTLIVAPASRRPGRTRASSGRATTRRPRPSSSASVPRGSGPTASSSSRPTTTSPSPPASRPTSAPWPRRRPACPSSSTTCRAAPASISCPRTSRGSGPSPRWSPSRNPRATSRR